jgi:hypothetical protein
MAEIIEKISKTIAEVEDTEPRQLNISLQNHISTDAIVELTNHESNSWRLQFETPHQVVEVAGNDTVTVDGKQT